MSFYLYSTNPLRRSRLTCHGIYTSTDRQPEELFRDERKEFSIMNVINSYELYRLGKSCNREKENTTSKPPSIKAPILEPHINN